MKTFTKLFSLVLLALPLLSSAAGSKSAAMQVSFEVKEACAVQSGGSAANGERPAVTCQLKSPYQVSRRSDKTTAVPAGSNDGSSAIRTQTGAQDWTITF